MLASKKSATPFRLHEGDPQEELLICRAVDWPAHGAQELQGGKQGVDGMIPAYVRWGFTSCFVTHIVITLLLDVQALPFGDNFPEVLKSLMRFHVETNHDYFMAKPTLPWLEGLIWVELLFHVPFFAFATAGFVRRWNAVRIPCIIYGTAAATSLVPILADVLASEKLTDPQRYKLICIYMPWLILPTVLVLVMAADPTPFGPGAAHPIASKRQ